MGNPVVTRSSYQLILQHLLALETELQRLHAELPTHTFNPSLINYSAFPLTHLLQRNDPQALPDRILEALFGCLTFLFQRWRECEGGMDVRAWEEMWIVTVMVIGGELDRKKPGPSAMPTSSKARETEDVVRGGTKTKGKGRELSEETQLAGLTLLHALLDPSPTGEDSEEDMDSLSDQERHPARPLMAGIFPELAAPSMTPGTTNKSLLPILFHTINTILPLSAPGATPNQTIRVSALQLLRTIITTYLRGRANILATLLPGIVSTCVRAVADEGKTKGLRGEIGKEICGLLGDVVVSTLGDDMLVELGVLKGQVTSLEELGADEDNADTPTSSAGPSAKPPESSPSNKTAFPPLTRTYLDFTAVQLLAAFDAVVPLLLEAHSIMVRLAAVNLANEILLACSESLPRCRDVLLRALLRSTLDDMPDVGGPAKSAVQGVLTGNNRCQATVDAILRDCLTRLPGTILSHNESKVNDNARTVAAIAALDIATPRGGPGLIGTAWWRSLGGDFASERWSWPLLVSLELGEGTAPASRPFRSTFALQAPDVKISSSPLAGADASGNLTTGGTVQGFPPVELVHVEGKETAAALSRMFEAVGCAASEDALPVLEHLLAVARSKHTGPELARATTALWLLECILVGLAKSNLERQGKRRLRKMASAIVITIVSLEDEEFDPDDVELGRGDNLDPFTDSAALVERRKGVNAVSTLLARPSRSTNASKLETRRLHLRQQRELLGLRSLSLLATCSEILSSAFRPLLLSSLYFLLSHLGSGSESEREYADLALHRVAYHSGYASAQNLLLDNIDYVINAVSQRMTFKRLSPLAPAVLIAMINIAGEAIVPLVQDVVDDVFEVLDEYHGYEVLCTAYLAVLDTLLKAMARDSDLDSWKPKQSTSARMRPGPSPHEDISKLEIWYKGRAIAAEKALDDWLEPTPKEPWKKPETTEGDAAEPADPPAGTEQEVEIPATRTQEVCARVLSKAGFFLTHPSAFIRARVLSLMASGIPVLVVGERESDVLPIIHRCWPYLLNRLKDAEPYVVVEAAALMSCLARWAGDFMSRRILEDAWPVLKALLNSQGQLDAASALARRNDNAGSSSPFTVSHRLHLSILTAMRYVVEEVPIVEDLMWEMILLFRPFLDSRVNGELRGGAIGMYRMMAERDEDAVWVALKATTGEVQEQSLRYLVAPGLDIGGSMDTIFQ